MKPTFNDVLNGSAHIIADGDCLRANVPAMFSDDPDAPMATVVSVYPRAGMPDHSEAFRLETTDAASLEAAIGQRYHKFRVRFDD